MSMAVNSCFLSATALAGECSAASGILSYGILDPSRTLPGDAIWNRCRRGGQHVCSTGTDGIHEGPLGLRLNSADENLNPSLQDVRKIRSSVAAMIAFATDLT